MAIFALGLNFYGPSLISEGIGPGTCLILVLTQAPDP